MVNQSALTLSLEELQRHPEEGLKRLEEYGAIVIKNIVSPQDCRKAAKDLKEFLHTSRVTPYHCGIVHRGGAGSLACLWELRLNQGVRAAYAALLGTSCLVASLDGFNAAKPSAS